MTTDTTLLYAVLSANGEALAEVVPERDAYDTACAIAARTRQDVALIRTHGPGAGVVPELWVTPQHADAMAALAAPRAVPS